MKCSASCACLGTSASSIACAASKRKTGATAPSLLRALRTTPPRDAAAAAAAAAGVTAASASAAAAAPPPPSPPPARAPPALSLAAAPSFGRAGTPWLSPPCLEEGGRFGKENEPPRTAGGRLAACCGGWSVEAGEEEGVLPNSVAHCPSPVGFGGRFGSGGRLSDAARGLGLLFENEKQRRPS